MLACAFLLASVSFGQADRKIASQADLSGLLAAAERAKPPADEQDTCKTLWADVQALLDNEGPNK